MQLSHTRPVARGEGRRPQSRVDRRAGPDHGIGVRQRRCSSLTDQHLSVPTDKGSNTGRKIGSLVAGMVAGADSITDVALPRHGAMGTVVDRPYAPSTLGSFLREYLRARPPARRRGIAVPGRTRRPRPGGRRHRHRTGAGRHRRFDHRSPRPRQTRVRGTKCQNPRPKWSDRARTKSGASNRSHRHKFTQRRYQR